MLRYRHMFSADALSNRHEAPRLPTIRAATAIGTIRSRRHGRFRRHGNATPSPAFPRQCSHAITVRRKIPRLYLPVYGRCRWPKKPRAIYGGADRGRAPIHYDDMIIEITPTASCHDRRCPRGACNTSTSRYINDTRLQQAIIVAAARRAPDAPIFARAFRHDGFAPRA